MLTDVPLRPVLIIPPNLHVSSDVSRTASYSIRGSDEYRFTVTVEDNRGRRAVDEYVGIPGKASKPETILGAPLVMLPFGSV
jgi:hypothetical protein